MGANHWLVKLSHPSEPSVLGVQNLVKSFGFCGRNPEPKRKFIMRIKRNAVYFGHGKQHRKVIQLVSLFLLIAWMIIMQDSAHAQSQQQNYNATTGTMTGVGVMYGVGAGICMAITAGGCTPIAVAGGILAGAGGTAAAMGGATGIGNNGHTGNYPIDMPDSGGNDFDGSGSGMGFGGGGGCAFSDENWWETIFSMCK